MHAAAHDINVRFLKDCYADDIHTPLPSPANSKSSFACFKHISAYSGSLSLNIIEQDAKDAAASDTTEMIINKIQGNTKTENVDDTITQGHSTLDRDVLQTVWGKTRANILDQIFELKDIYYEMIESFNNIFMGLY